MNIGDKIPAVSLPANSAADGSARDVSLSDYQGRKLVVYFYPKDNTPGCTTEAIDFTAKLKAFEDANTVIIGVSADSVKKHDNFVAKHDLGITLLSDENHDLLSAFGVWVEKSMYGKKFMGIERATFLIDENGTITDIWRKVKVKGHVDAVLSAAQG